MHLESNDVFIVCPVQNSGTDNRRTNDMPKQSSLPLRTALLGDSASALEISFLLLLDALALTAPATVRELVTQLDAMLARRLPTPGIQAHITQTRDHLVALVGTDNGLPN